jgi:hypothetical protein
MNRKNRLELVSFQYKMLRYNPSGGTRQDVGSSRLAREWKLLGRPENRLPLKVQVAAQSIRYVLARDSYRGSTPPSKTWFCRS